MPHGSCGGLEDLLAVEAVVAELHLLVGVAEEAGDVDAVFFVREEEAMELGANEPC